SGPNKQMKRDCDRHRISRQPKYELLAEPAKYRGLARLEAYPLKKYFRTEIGEGSLCQIVFSDRHAAGYNDYVGPRRGVRYFRPQLRNIVPRDRQDLDVTTESRCQCVHGV